MLRKLSLLFGTFFTLVISFTHLHIVKGLWIIPVTFIIGYVGFIVFFFTFCWIISLFISFKKEYKKHPKFFFVLLNLVEGYIINLFRIKLVVKDYNLVPKDQKYLVVFNHRSLADPIIISSILKRDKVVHISKPENFKAFIAGKYIHRCGYLAINRDNDRQALETILKCIDYIKKQEFSLGVSPEGTRNKVSDNSLLPFKPGMFKIATKSNAPIVAATIKNSEKIIKNFPFKQTVVYVDFVKVIYPEEYVGKTTMEISNMVRSLMNNDLGYPDDVIKNIDTTE